MDFKYCIVNINYPYNEFVIIKLISYEDYSLGSNQIYCYDCDVLEYYSKHSYSTKKTTIPDCSIPIEIDESVYNTLKQNLMKIHKLGNIFDKTCKSLYGTKTKNIKI